MHLSPNKKTWLYSTLILTFLFLQISVTLSPIHAALKTYKIDKSHSEVSFNLKHFTISKITGGFETYNATIQWDKENPSNSSFSSVISVKSINTNNKERDSHLKENEFFEANRFPYIKFNSNEISKKNNIYYVEGILTIKNISKNISFPLITTGPVEDLNGTKRLGFETNFFINRKDYGINWNKKLRNGGLIVGNTVNINLFIEAIELQTDTKETIAKKVR